MSNLTYQESTQFPGLEVVIMNDGTAWVTQSSYARFTGLTQQGISKRSKEYHIVDLDNMMMYQLLEGTTTEVVVPLIRTRLENKSGSSEVVLIPAEIFGMWIVKDNFDLGLQIIKAGATQFLYHAVGRKIGVIETGSETEVLKLKSDISDLKLMVSRILENQQEQMNVKKLSGRKSSEIVKYDEVFGDWVKGNLEITNNEDHYILLSQFRNMCTFTKKMSGRYISMYRKQLVEFFGWELNGHKNDRVGQKRNTCFYGIIEK